MSTHRTSGITLPLLTKEELELLRAQAQASASFTPLAPPPSGPVPTAPPAPTIQEPQFPGPAPAGSLPSVPATGGELLQKAGSQLSELLKPQEALTQLGRRATERLPDIPNLGPAGAVSAFRDVMQQGRDPFRPGGPGERAAALSAHELAARIAQSEGRPGPDGVSRPQFPPLLEGIGALAESERQEPLAAQIIGGAATDVTLAVPGIGIPRLGAKAAVTGARAGARTARAAARTSLARSEAGAVDFSGALRSAIPEELPENTVFVKSVRPLQEGLDEVKTMPASAIRAIMKPVLATVNPSVLRNTLAGRLMVNAQRRLVDAESMIDVALSAAYDTHRTRFLTTSGHVFPIDADGIWRGTGRHWEDVFARPGDYELTEAQQAFIRDLLRVVDEANHMLEQAGLPRNTVDKEGWFYFPRQVRSADGVEFTRPSNPNLLRVYEDATDGLKAGVQYNNDPRAVLELHLKRAYRDILDREISLAAKASSITPKQLLRAIRPEVVSAYDNATLAVRSQQRTVRRLQNIMRMLQVGEAPKGLGKEAAAIRAARAEERAAFQVYIDGAKAQLADLQTIRNQARNAYRAELDRAKAAGKAPGRLFGPDQPDGPIPVKLWRNRLFPEEMAKEFDEGVTALFGKQKGNFATAALANVARYVRLAATLDFALPLTHGLPTLARRPDVWAKGSLLHYAAAFDPTVQARYIRNNITGMQDMIRLGGVPATPSEFFEALNTGKGVARLMRRLPVVGEPITDIGTLLSKQSFGRFQAAYDTGLTVYRHQLWEALKDSSQWRGQLSELGAYIRNMTGGLDSRALGVGPNQRNLESMWLAFSPRLLRSTVALVADATKLGTVRGRQSLVNLATLLSAATGLYFMTAMALGKSKEEILVGLNPLSGKKFLSFEIDGDWIGIGGQHRAIVQALFAIASLTTGTRPLSDAFKLDLRDNPFFAIWASRGAPGLQIGGALMEGFTGGEVDALPYDRVDGPVDAFKHIVGAAKPFSLAGWLEGENPATVGFAVTGFRTSPETRREARERLRPQVIAQINEERKAAGQAPIPQNADEEDIGVGPRIKARIEEELDKERKLEQFAPDLPSQEEQTALAFQTINQSELSMAQGILAAIQDRAGGEAIRRAISDGRTRTFQVGDALFTEEINRALSERKNQTFTELGRAAYWSVPLEMNKNGEPDFDKRDQEREQILQELVRNLPEAQQQTAIEFITERAPITDNPEVKAALSDRELQAVQKTLDAYDEDQKLLRIYFKGSNDYITERLEGHAQLIWLKYLEGSQVEQDLILKSVPSLRQAIDARAKVRLALRDKSPEIDKAVVRWGYALPLP